MKVKFKFAPGQKVEDLLTGVTGLISSSSLTAAGYNQHGVQPASKEGDGMPDAWHIDDIQLKLLSEGLDNKKVFEVDFKYTPESKARDTITNLKGTITRCLYYLNGCIHYHLQAEIMDGKIPEPISVDEQFIELIKSTPAPNLEEETRRGPSEKAI